jgi:hypothetical protein
VSFGWWPVSGHSVHVHLSCWNVVYTSSCLDNKTQIPQICWTERAVYNFTASI